MKTPIALFLGCFVVHLPAQTTNWIPVQPISVTYWGATVDTNGARVWSTNGAPEQFLDVQKHWFFDGNGNISVNADGTLSTNGVRFDDEDEVYAFQYQPSTNLAVLATNPCAMTLWVNLITFTNNNGDNVYELNHGETREQGAFPGFFLFKKEIDFSPPTEDALEAAINLVSKSSPTSHQKKKLLDAMPSETFRMIPRNK